MIGRVRDLVMRMTASKKLTVAAVDEELAKAREERDWAEVAYRNTEESLAGVLMSTPRDREAWAKVQAEVREAAGLLQERRDRVDALEALRERAEAAEARLEHERRVEKARANGKAFVSATETVEECVQALADALTVAEDTATAFRESLPVAVPISENLSMLYARPTLLHRIRMRLYGLSDGRFKARGVIEAPREIAAGPALPELAQETVDRALAYSENEAHAAENLEPAPSS